MSQVEGVCGDKLACGDDPRIMSDKSIRQNTPIPAWQNTQMETWQNTNTDIYLLNISDFDTLNIQGIVGMYFLIFT